MKYRAEIQIQFDSSNDEWAQYYMSLIKSHLTQPTFHGPALVEKFEHELYREDV